MNSVSQYIKNKIGYALFVFCCIILLLYVFSKIAPKLDPKEKVFHTIESKIQYQKSYYKESLENTPIADSIIIDIRDGQSYRIRRFGNLWWMIDNLNFDTEDTVVYREQYIGRVSRQYDKKPAYGYFYDKVSAQYACPASWRLPFDIEWKIINDVYVRCHKEKNAATGSYRIDSILLEPDWAGEFYLADELGNKEQLYDKKYKFRHSYDYKHERKPYSLFHAHRGLFFIDKELCSSNVRQTASRVQLYSCRCVQDAID